MAKKKSGIPPQKIILGFTGSLGSGCTFIAKGIAEHYNKYKYYSLSNILKEIAHEKSIEPTLRNLQDLGNELRAKKGNSYLVQLLDKKIKNFEESELKDAEGLIIDSIRNDDEVNTLKQFPFFYLFSIHADEETRCKRKIKDKRVSNEKEFKNADNRDQAEDFIYGQQVNKV